MPRPRAPDPLKCGCDSPHFALGLCSRHYERQRTAKRRGPPKSRKNLSGCSEPGCPGEYHARGLCQMHYQRVRPGKLKAQAARPPRPYHRNPLVPRIEELAETMTQAQIAKLLNIGRNVVIGAVDRGRKMCRLPDPKAKPKKPYVPPRDIFPPPCTCLWMDGDPRDPDSQFCGEPVFIFGEAWCMRHRARVYVPRRDVSTPSPARNHALAAAATAD